MLKATSVFCVGLSLFLSCLLVEDCNAASSGGSNSRIATAARNKAKREAAAALKNGYIFLAAKAFNLNTKNELCVIFKGQHDGGEWSAVLVQETGKENKTIAQKSKSFDGGATESCANLVVKPTPDLYSATLVFTITFAGEAKNSKEERRSIRIIQDSYVVIIVPSKPIYKPEKGLVQFRILVTDAAVRPKDIKFKSITITNPQQVRIQQWNDVSTDLGLLELSFLLPEEPVQGVYTITAQRPDGSWGNQASFRVEPYVAPTFEVSVNPPNYVYLIDDKFKLKVCAKYTFGQCVVGDLYVRLYQKLYNWEVFRSDLFHGENRRPLLEINEKIEPGECCKTLDINTKDLGFRVWNINPAFVEVFATVTENGTGVAQNTSSTINVVNTEANIVFRDDFIDNKFKPGLPYFGRLQVTKPDGTPSPGERVKLCITTFDLSGAELKCDQCAEYKTGKKGQLNFVVGPQCEKTFKIQIKAWALDHPDRYYFPHAFRIMLQPTSTLEIQPWYSPSNYYLAIQPPSADEVACDTTLTAIVLYTGTQENSGKPTQLYYKILAKSVIVQSGKKLIEANKVQVTKKDYKNTIGWDHEGEEKEFIIYKAEIPIQVTPKLATRFEVLVFYIKDDKEVIAGSLEVQTDKCLENKVKLKWKRDVQRPGELTTLDVTASCRSLCAVRASDYSLDLLSGSNEITKQSLFDSLEIFQGFRDSPDNYAYCTRRFQELSNEKNASAGGGAPNEDGGDSASSKALIFPRPLPQGFSPQSNYFDSSAAFEAAGVVTASNLKIESRPCDLVQFNRPVFYNGATTRFGKSRGAALALESAPMADFDGIRAKTSFSIGGPPGAGGGSAESNIVRSNFLEQFIYDLERVNCSSSVPASKSSTVAIDRTLPDTITKWIGTAFCTNKETGIGVANPENITTFLPFFVDIVLPYSMIRGEILPLAASVFNYLNETIPVKVKISANAKQIKFLSNTTATACIKPQDTFVTIFRLKPLAIGDINITVEAAIDSSLPLDCSSESSAPNSKDTVIKPLKVKADGFPQDKTTTELACVGSGGNGEEAIYKWNLQSPQNTIDGSLRSWFTAIGDILGTSGENLDKQLISTPSGSGNYNLLVLAANKIIMDYLKATGSLTDDKASKIKDNLQAGYQKQLAYRRYDGSYSQYGNADQQPSLWLTASVIGVYSGIQKHVFIDKDDLQRTVNWLVTQQDNDSGCFPFLGYAPNSYLSNDTKDASQAALAAIVADNLLYAAKENAANIPQSAIEKAIKCAKSEPKADTYPLSVITNTLFTAQDGDKDQYLTQLKAKEIKDQKDETIVHLEAKQGANFYGPLDNQATSLLILSLVQAGGQENLDNALGAIRWLVRSRNAYGGWYTSEDTLLALRAINAFLEAKHSSSKINQIVDLKATNLLHALNITDLNRVVTQQVDIPTVPTELGIKVTGTGCSLIQSVVRYNVPQLPAEKVFDLKVDSPTHWGLDPSCKQRQVNICVTYKLADQRTRGGVIEVKLISGFGAVADSVKDLELDQFLGVRHTSASGDSVVIEVNEFTESQKCFQFRVQLQVPVEELKRGTVKVYDPVRPAVEATETYSVANECSSQFVANQTTTTPP